MLPLNHLAGPLRILFFKFFLILFYVCVCEYLYVCGVCMLVPRETKEDIRSQGTTVTVRCDPPCGC